MKGIFSEQKKYEYSVPKVNSNVTANTAPRLPKINFDLLSDELYKKGDRELMEDNLAALKLQNYHRQSTQI